MALIYILPLPDRVQLEAVLTSCDKLVFPLPEVTAVSAATLPVAETVPFPLMVVLNLVRLTGLLIDTFPLPVTVITSISLKVVSTSIFPLPLTISVFSESGIVILTLAALLSSTVDDGRIEITRFWLLTFAIVYFTILL